MFLKEISLSISALLVLVAIEGDALPELTIAKLLILASKETLQVILLLILREIPLIL